MLLKNWLCFDFVDKGVAMYFMYFTSEYNVKKVQSIHNHKLS